MAARCSRGLNPVESLRTRQLNQVIHGAAEAAQIDKRVSMHTLRHYSEFRTMPRQVGASRRQIGFLLTIRGPDRARGRRGPAWGGREAVVR